MGAARPALEAYERCLRLFPNLEPARLEPILFGKAVAQQLLKKFSEATESYGRVLELNPRSEEALSNAVAVHLELKDHATGRSVRGTTPEDPAGLRVAHEGLAAAAFALQDYEKAAAHCAALVKVAPDAFEGWFNLGVALEKAGRPEAAKAYGEALRLRPNDAELQLNLAVAYEESGDRAKARESYQRALELNPESTTALWNLALALEQDGKPAEAEKLYTRMLDQAPDSEDARFRLGCLRLELGDFRRRLRKPLMPAFGNARIGPKLCSTPASRTGN